MEDFEPEDWETIQARRDEQEYQMGKDDGRRYSENRKLFGDKIAEQIAINEEQRRYDEGEDD